LIWPHLLGSAYNTNTVVKTSRDYIRIGISDVQRRVVEIRSFGSYNSRSSRSRPKKNMPRMDSCLNTKILKVLKIFHKKTHFIK